MAECASVKDKAAFFAKEIEKLNVNEFNVADAKWAVDLEKFPLNKYEAEWKNRSLEDDGWMHAHNALRAEMDAFESALKAFSERCSKGDKNADDWELEAMRKYFDAHKAFVTMHHRNEDEMMTPTLQERIKLPEKLTTDHQGIIENLAKIETAMAAAEEKKDAASVKAVSDAFCTYCAHVKPHLIEEEQIGLPLSRAYFSPKEIGAVVQKIMNHPEAPDSEVGSFIHCMGANNFRNSFMKQEGIPFFAWHIGGFKKKFNNYKNKIVPACEALQKGDEGIWQLTIPKTQKGWFAAFSMKKSDSNSNNTAPAETPAAAPTQTVETPAKPAAEKKCAPAATTEGAASPAAQPESKAKKAKKGWFAAFSTKKVDQNASTETAVIVQKEEKKSAEPACEKKDEQKTEQPAATTEPAACDKKEEKKEEEKKAEPAAPTTEEAPAVEAAPAAAPAVGAA